MAFSIELELAIFPELYGAISAGPEQKLQRSVCQMDLANLPILPAAWKYQVSASTKKQFGILKQLMEREYVKSLICATDAGREGKLIFRLVYHQAGCSKPFFRLWISSMEDQAIRDDFAHLEPSTKYDALHEAALCRDRADWIVGINATRLFSCLYHQTLNVGRVMTPALAMVVLRDAEIAVFKPQSFYTVQLAVGGITAVSKRFERKSEAEQLLAKCRENGKATIKSLERKEKSERAPLLYDLTSLQQDANRMLGFTAQQTMDYTQALYEKKLSLTHVPKSRLQQKVFGSTSGGDHDPQSRQGCLWCIGDEETAEGERTQYRVR